jgi:hypothetical protein
MLFTYRYVNHSITRLQEYVDHLVKEVWCKASGDFSLDLLHPDMKVIVEDIFNDASITTDPLYGPIQEIYELFRTQLTTDQRRQVGIWCDNNNDIEALCSNALGKTPGTYADIRALNVELETALKSFFKSLFTQVIKLNAVTSRIGSIEDHYVEFAKANAEEKCPYCGYSDIRGANYTTRDAYDHFLPKGTYPFNSVNFRNLSPMCPQCNSSYKLQKDPMMHIDPINKSDGTRRKAFYSYAAESPGIHVKVILKTKDVADLKSSDIDLTFTAPGYEEEVGAWKDVYGIEERYKAKLCAQNDGTVWLQRIIEDCENIDVSRDKLLAYELKNAERFPYNDAGFLKKPFLIACKEANII